jgi:hypothetical protein
MLVLVGQNALRICGRMPWMLPKCASNARWRSTIPVAARVGRHFRRVTLFDEHSCSDFVAPRPLNSGQAHLSPSLTSVKFRRVLAEYGVFPPLRFGSHVHRWHSACYRESRDAFPPGGVPRVNGESEGAIGRAWATVVSCIRLRCCRSCRPHCRCGGSRPTAGTAVREGAGG